MREATTAEEVARQRADFVNTSKANYKALRELQQSIQPATKPKTFKTVTGTSKAAGSGTSQPRTPNTQPSLRKKQPPRPQQRWPQLRTKLAALRTQCACICARWVRSNS